MMVDYVDANRQEFGVEPICAVLQFSSSTYYAAKSRVPSARSLRDAVWLPIILTLWMANYEVYGVRKMWKAMGRAGHTDIGRDQVGRLMAELGIQGVQKRLTRRTTVPDASADRHPDLVDRQFTADRPNALWVTDLTLSLVDLDTSNGPDLRVILSPKPPAADDWYGFDDDAVELGRLKGNRGTQTYDVPDGLDVTTFASVVIWCERFSVGFGGAPLR